MNSTPNKFKFDMVPYTRGVGIEVLDSDEKLFPHFIKWSEEALHILRPGTLDFVVLQTEGEDISKYVSLIKQGGYVNVVMPNSMPVATIGGLELQETIVVDELRYAAFRKPGGHDWGTIPSIPDKKCAIIRYGGIGDMMMAACVFPELKKQGYHVTLYTHVNSYETVKLDPYVDRFVVQDSEQVPAHEFRTFVFHLMKKYDKVINLSESIEGSLLALPDRVSYYWPKEYRHEIMGKNYYDATAKISGVPKNLTGKFYASQKEKTKAKQRRKKINAPVIVWVLSGSSVHKFWPWLDNVLASIMLSSDAHVVLVGDVACKLMEQGWDNEPRVHKKCGQWSVRETMTFCKYSDLIITPETGVALGVQFEDIPKFLLHSHSHPDNYAVDWKNCTSFIPEDCECYPCHQMHYGFEYCTQVGISNETDKEYATFAKCQVNISPEIVLNSIQRWYECLLKEEK